MKSIYKSLGNYIHEVDIRNTDMSVTKLMGVNLSKKMMPSVANVIGTDLSVYKVVKKRQFACKLMSVGRDACLPIALKLDDEPVIISSAYYAFEVNDEDEILPEYLMLCFLRPDFDRELWFRTGGDVRGGVTWDAFCNICIPILPIAEQRILVNQYQVISDRMNILRDMNSCLQSIIDTYFEQFYETYCKTEVNLSDLCALTSSKRVFAEDYVSEGIPFYRGGEISLKKIGEPIEDPLFISREQYNAIKKNYGIPSKGDILITAVGTIGNSYFVEDEDFYFKDGNIIWLKDFIEEGYRYFVYDFLQSKMFKVLLNSLYIGSTQIALTIVGLSQLKLNIPSISFLKEYEKNSAKLRKSIQDNQNELSTLHNLSRMLLVTGA